MTDIADFIRSRLDEDAYITETTRTGGYEAPVWRALEDRTRNDLDGDETFVQIHAYERGFGEPAGMEEDYGEIVGYINNGRWADKHVAQWDPDRVLRGIAAKRQLVDAVMAWEHQLLYSGYDENTGPYPCSREGVECDPVMCGVGGKQRQVLGALASEWATHEAYQKEWAVD